MKHVKLFEQYISEGIFNTYTELLPYDYDKFVTSFKELHKDNIVTYDKKEDVSYGHRKGSKQSFWKYFHDEYNLYHSEKERDVLGLINFKNMVAKGHPWSK